MDIQKQVCSWEQSLKLKKLGIKQDGYFTWMECRLSKDGDNFHSWWAVFRPNNGDYDFMTDMQMPEEFEESYPSDQEFETDKEASAFTIAELSEMLPGLIEKDRQYELVIIKEDDCWLCRYCAGNNINITIEKDANKAGSTLAYTMADLLIYLIEKNIITSQQINEMT